MKELKKVLIVELFSHYKVLDNISNLLRNKCLLTFYVIKDKYNILDKLFPNAKNENLITNNHHFMLFFLKLTSILIQGN